MTYLYKKEIHRDLLVLRSRERPLGWLAITKASTFQGPQSPDNGFSKSNRSYYGREKCFLHSLTVLTQQTTPFSIWNASGHGLSCLSNHTQVSPCDITHLDTCSDWHEVSRLPTCQEPSLALSEERVGGSLAPQNISLSTWITYQNVLNTSNFFWKEYSILIAAKLQAMHSEFKLFRKDIRK
jgi:hypothetical protein